MITKNKSYQKYKQQFSELSNQFNQYIQEAANYSSTIQSLYQKVLESQPQMNDNGIIFEQLKTVLKQIQQGVDISCGQFQELSEMLNNDDLVSYWFQNYSLMQQDEINKKLIGKTAEKPEPTTQLAHSFQSSIYEEEEELQRALLQKEWSMSEKSRLYAYVSNKIDAKTIQSQYFQHRSLNAIVSQITKINRIGEEYIKKTVPHRVIWNDTLNDLLVKGYEECAGNISMIRQKYFPTAISDELRRQYQELQVKRRALSKKQ